MLSDVVSRRKKDIWGCFRLSVTFMDCFPLCRNDITAFSEDIRKMLMGWRKYSGLVSDKLLSFYDFFCSVETVLRCFLR